MKSDKAKPLSDQDIASILVDIPNKFEDSPYEPDERAEIGEPLFEEFKELLEPVTMLISRGPPRPSPRATKVFEDAALLVASAQAVLTSHMVYSSSWLGGEFMRVQCKPLPTPMLLMCLSEFRLMNLSETNVLDLMVTDLGVYDLVIKLLEEWDMCMLFPGLYKLLLVSSTPKKRSVPFKSSSRRLECHKAAIFVARAYQCVEVLRPQSIPLSLTEKIESCLFLMWENRADDVKSTSQRRSSILKDHPDLVKELLSNKDAPRVKRNAKRRNGPLTSDNGTMGASADEPPYDESDGGMSPVEEVEEDASDTEDDTVIEGNERDPVELCSRLGFVLHRFYGGVIDASVSTGIHPDKIRKHLRRPARRNKNRDLYWRYVVEEGAAQRKSPLRKKRVRRKEYIDVDDSSGDISEEKRITSDGNESAFAEETAHSRRAYKKVNGESNELSGIAMDATFDADDDESEGSEAIVHGIAKGASGRTRQQLSEEELKDIPKFNSNEFQIIWKVLQKHGWMRESRGSNSYFKSGSEGCSIPTPKILMWRIKNDARWHNNDDILDAIDEYRSAMRERARGEKAKTSGEGVPSEFDERELANLTFDSSCFRKALWPGLELHGWQVELDAKGVALLSHPECSNGSKLFRGVPLMMKHMQEHDTWGNLPWFRASVADFKRRLAEDVRKQQNKRGMYVSPKRKRPPSSSDPDLPHKKSRKTSYDESPSSSHVESNERKQKKTPKASLLGPIEKTSAHVSQKREVADTWAFLRKLGWTVGRAKYGKKLFFPPGVSEETGVCRVDYFDSVRLAFTYAANDERWSSMKAMKKMKARYPRMLKSGGVSIPKKRARSASRNEASSSQNTESASSLAPVTVTPAAEPPTVSADADKTDHTASTTLKAGDPGKPAPVAAEQPNAEATTPGLENGAATKEF